MNELDKIVKGYEKAGWIRELIVCPIEIPSDYTLWFWRYKFDGKLSITLITKQRLIEINNCYSWIGAKEIPNGSKTLVSLIARQYGLQWKRTFTFKEIRSRF